MKYDLTVSVKHDCHVGHDRISWKRDIIFESYQISVFVTLTGVQLFNLKQSRCNARKVFKKTEATVSQIKDQNDF